MRKKRQNLRKKGGECPAADVGRFLNAYFVTDHCADLHARRADGGSAVAGKPRNDLPIRLTDHFALRLFEKSHLSISGSSKAMS